MPPQPGQRKPSATKALRTSSSQLGRSPSKRSPGRRPLRRHRRTVAGFRPALPTPRCPGGTLAAGAIRRPQDVAVFPQPGRPRARRGQGVVYRGALAGRGVQAASPLHGGRPPRGGAGLPRDVRVPYRRAHVEPMLNGRNGPRDKGFQLPARAGPRRDRSTPTATTGHGVDPASVELTLTTGPPPVYVRRSTAVANSCRPSPPNGHKRALWNV